MNLTYLDQFALTSTLIYLSYEKKNEMCYGFNSLFFKIKIVFEIIYKKKKYKFSHLNNPSMAFCEHSENSHTWLTSACMIAFCGYGYWEQLGSSSCWAPNLNYNKNDKLQIIWWHKKQWSSNKKRKKNYGNLRMTQFMSSYPIRYYERIC